MNWLQTQLDFLSSNWLMALALYVLGGLTFARVMGWLNGTLAKVTPKPPAA